MLLELDLLIKSDLKSVPIIDITESSIFFIIIVSKFMAELVARDLHDDHAAGM